MSADLLRRAADRLDELAGAARAGDWYAEGADVHAMWALPRPVATCAGSLPEGNVANAAYIAALGPNVGTALAAWLRSAIPMWERIEYQNGRHPDDDGQTRILPNPIESHAVEVARQILGPDAA